MDKDFGRTLKVEGCLGGYPILFLLDSRASHNFIATELVAYLGLPIIKNSEVWS